MSSFLASDRRFRDIRPIVTETGLGKTPGRGRQAGNLLASPGEHRVSNEPIAHVSIRVARIPSVEIDPPRGCGNLYPEPTRRRTLP